MLKANRDTERQSFSMLQKELEASRGERDAVLLVARQETASEVGAMQMQLAGTQTERDQLRAEVESLNQQMSNREMVMQEEPGDVAALHQSLVEEQQMTRLLQEELEVARSEKDAAIVTLQKRMVAAEERFTSLQSDMEARQEELGDVAALHRSLVEEQQMTRLLQEELEVARSEKDAAI